MNWDQWADGICEAVAAKSKDPNTKLGCVITSIDHSILSTGFNGFCRGVREDIPARWADRTTKYWFVEHAERNAIYNAVRHGICLDKSIAYIPVSPCVECAKGLIQSGIIQVRMNLKRNKQRQWDLEERLSPAEYKKWTLEVQDIRLMFVEAGVEVDEYTI